MIFNGTDNFQELADIMEQRGACEEGVGWCREQGDITCTEAFQNMINQNDFNTGWADWNIENLNDVISVSLQDLFIEKIIKNPRRAAHTYLNNTKITVRQRNELLRSFHSEVRPDGKVLFPTIEMEIRTNKVKPKFRGEA